MSSFISSDNLQNYAQHLLPLSYPKIVVPSVVSSEPVPTEVTSPSTSSIAHGASEGVVQTHQGWGLLHLKAEKMVITIWFYVY